MEPPVLRLFRFRAMSPSFDAKLRTLVIPDLIRLPGMLAVFAGRAGPDTEQTRLLASVWGSRRELEAALGPHPETRRIQAELGEATAEGEIEVLDLAFALPPEMPTSAGILRLVRGTSRGSCLDEYVREASRGAQTDRADGIGPQAFYLAVEPPTGFLTLSLWDEWAHVAAATGADFTSVDRTRHAELLDAWAVEHFEVIPGLVAGPWTQSEREPG